MVMPAFDMESGSTSAPPDGNLASPGPDGTAVAPGGPDATPARAPAGESATAKPPPASLISITAKSKTAGAKKSGDLTRLFELAHRGPPAALVEPAPAVEPAPSAPATAIFDRPPEPAPISDAAPDVPESLVDADLPLMLAPPFAVEVSDDLASGPVEPAPAAEPPTPSPITVDPVTETAERRPAIPAPSASTSPSLEVPERAPEPPPAPKPDAPEARAHVEPLAVPASPTAPRALKFAELADYWRSLRKADEHPAAEAIDRDFITERWPGSLLIAYTPASQDPRGEPRPGRVTRLGTACAETQSAIDAGSHSTEWMLEVARAALVNDEPVEEQQRMATLTGDAGFRMVALPLGPPKGLPNAVLCMLLPSPGAPRFGKRRIWL